MVFIKYPLVSLDGREDIKTWKAKPIANFRKGDWTGLRDYLTAHLQHPQGKVDIVPKCWYSEMPQSDKFVQDVEHFRPKKRATPLTSAQTKLINEMIGYKVPESNITGAYQWLEFNSINNCPDQQRRC
jgi:hypothetical protein